MHSLTRRAFLQSTSAAVLANAIRPATSAAQPTVPGRPDVLVLMTDQWNPRMLGYAGDPDVRTPNLDALAAQACRFDHCYSNCPVCMPARTSFVSGLFPHHTRLWGNADNFYIEPSLTPLFSDVKAAGYTTAQIGKLHWWSGKGYRRDFDSVDNYLKGMGLDHGEEIATPFSTQSGDGSYQQHLKKLGLYDAYKADMIDRLTHGQYVPRPSVVQPEDHNDWFIGDRCIRYVQEHPRTKPFFLVASFPGPHTPLDASGRYEKMYRPESLRMDPNVRPARSEGNEYDLDGLRRCKANYLGKLTMIDDCVGRMIAALKARGTWDNTIVFFTADHGEMMGAQGRMSKTVFWEESGRVPLLVRVPGVPARVSTELVQFSDVYATVVDLIGGRRSPGNFSVSLAPVVRGEKPAPRRAAFSEISHQGSLDYMVRDARFKWFVMQEKEYLYDLREDPYEQRNLINEAGQRDRIVGLKELQREFVTGTQINYAAGYKPKTTKMREAAEK